MLPRWLRRPARLVTRLAAGRFEPPPFAATAMTAALFAAAGLYGMAAGGHTADVVAAVTARSGFAIADVAVSGNRETSEIDVLQAVGLDGWTSLVGFDAAAARARIAALPWVEEVSVRKVYPARLEVEIAERRPFAIWQHGSRLTLIERDGAVIAPFGGRRHAALPLVIGMGAAEDGAAFVATVARHPAIAARVKAYIRVAERRWDLRLESGITVKLPEGAPQAALAELAALDRDVELLARDIEAVDMRLADRLVVRLTPEAAEARAEAIEAAMDGRPAGTRI